MESIREKMLEKLHVCMIIGTIQLPNTTGFQTKETLQIV